MLNRTTRVQVDSVLNTFLTTWPDPESVVRASVEDISNVIRPLGICHRRAKAIIRFSKEYIDLTKQKKEEGKEDGGVKSRMQNLLAKNPVNGSHGRTVSCQEFMLTRDEVLNLYNCGQYAYDAYQIFVQRRKHTVTSDHALQYYVDYYRGLNSLGGFGRLNWGGL